MYLSPQTKFLVAIVFFSLLSPFCTLAQNNTEYDSLLMIYQKQPDDSSKVNTLNRLHELTLNNDIDLAKKYVEEELVLAKKINFKRGIGSAFYNLGGYFENIGVRDSAKYYLEQSKKFFDELGELKRSAEANKAIAINEYYQGNPSLALERVVENIQNRITLKDSLGLAADYNFQGGIYRQLGKTELALKSVMTSFKIQEELNNRVGMADAMQVLAALEVGQKSIDYEKEALAIYEEEGDQFYQALVNNNLGTSYIHNKDFDKAELHIQKAIDLATELNAVDIVGDATTKMSHVHMNQGNYELAIASLKEALAIHNENKQAIARAENLGTIAIAYNKMNQPLQALPYIDECLELSASINSLSSEKGAYEIRSESYRLLGNYKKALADHTQFKVLNDSLFNNEKTEQIERLKTEFEVERKETELVMEKNKVVLLEKEAKLSALQKWFLSIGLLFSFVTLGLMFYGFRQKAKAAAQEKEKLDAELSYKKKELTTHALHLAKKNELLEGLKQKAKELKENAEEKQGYQKLIRTIDFDLMDDNNWENFANYFQQVHKDFNQNVARKYPDVTPNELRLISLVKMNLSIKEMANIMNISVPGVKKARQRLRKKMNLETKDSLEMAVLGI